MSRVILFLLALAVGLVAAAGVAAFAQWKKRRARAAGGMVYPAASLEACSKCGNAIRKVRGQWLHVGTESHICNVTLQASPVE